MLFHVEMDVIVPHDFDPERFETLRAAEKQRAQELQRDGVWRHLWRVVGEHKNVSVFDVESNAQLHDILSTLPLFPFMKIKVTALCRHPSSIRDDET
jgi:muconolactone D-isomerase